MDCSLSHPLMPASVAPGYGEESFHILDTDSKHTAFGRTSPQPSRLLPPNWHYNCLQQALHFYIKEPNPHGKTRGFQARGPTVKFSGCEGFLGQNHCCVEYHGSGYSVVEVHWCCFGRSIMCKKGKSVTRMSIYSSKDKALSFHRRGGSM